MGAADPPLQESGWSGRHPHGRETRRICVFFKTALVLLMAWLLGVLGVFDVGQAVHVLLLVGLLFLLLAATKGGDTAVSRDTKPKADGR